MDALDVQRAMIQESVQRFVRESNTIEGIGRPPTKDEVDVHIDFLLHEEVKLFDLKALVATCAGSRAGLRVLEGMDVVIRSGNKVMHRPPKGGKNIELQLGFILERAMLGEEHPYEIHQCYEALHPFMDGNGRSGRALWAWMMLRQERPFWELGFLHTWYYQSLQFGRKWTALDGTENL